MEFFALGHSELAFQVGGKKTDHGNGNRYIILPPGQGNSWIIDLHPDPDLVVSNAYFTLPYPVTFQYNTQQHFLWLCFFESGDATIIEKGKKPKKLQTGGIYVFVSQGRPFKMVFNHTERILYTSILITADHIARYFQNRSGEEPFAAADALHWLSTQYNTPELAMAFEQLKYGIRWAIAPPMYFEGKVLEILGLIRCNVKHEVYCKKHTEKQMRNRLTYQNKKYIWQVKAALDEDILNPPTIEQLAIIAEMGTTRLRQRFKGLYRVTIAEYIRREKMKYALQLLGNDDMSIHNIATTLGYKSASQFTAAFQKIHSVTPSHFRKSLGL
ncbi:helix-turn-helix transcriptional regulator [Pelosinus propionicus]|uniref:AraC-type DNA-binding protein n=1 Tax=Pelosinus propionicus DSM 13327 TaxID=1123291 RepID=A0A1I4PZL3_9FIRM|nr:AraC family transcriptional regulator [Pelosinus propionicus]SFM32853.1 AraC-type DNA-binding protein [Pelosinus propionicus DSM 13327]